MSEEEEAAGQEEMQIAERERLTELATSWMDQLVRASTSKYVIASNQVF